MSPVPRPTQAPWGPQCRFRLDRRAPFFAVNSWGRMKGVNPDTVRIISTVITAAQALAGFM